MSLLVSYNCSGNILLGIKMSKVYKSTPNRLYKFFEESRNAWRKKTILAKAELKNANKKLKYTKEKVTALRAEIKNLKVQVSELKKSVPEKKMM